VRRLLLLMSLFLAGCQSVESGVQLSVDFCCTETDAHSFQLVDEGIPPFLGPLLSANVTSALLNKGYYPQEENADLIVVVSFESDGLPILAQTSPFDEIMSESGDLRFMAGINIEISSMAGVPVFQGTIYRSHDVSANEYMHTGRASMAMFEALTRLFEPLPVTTD
jgi:hypothetical protein